MLIAVDASTRSTGFAFGGFQDGSPRGGVWQLPGADELVFDRTLSLAGDSLSELARMVRAERVVIEAPLLIIDREHSRDSASALIQLTGAIRAAAHRAKCRVTLLSVDKVRKHFIGTSRLPRAEAKRAVMDRCRALGWPFQNDDQADAAALWAYAMSLYYPAWSPKCVRAA